MDEGLGQNITYTILGFSLGLLFGFLWEISTLKIKHLAHQNGYHYHHSLFGLVALLFIPIIWRDIDKMLFVIGFGLGVIIQHAITESFVFITKD